MGRYMVLNKHAPEECEPMEADIDKIGPELKGTELFCTCPAGEHAYYVFIEGETSEQVLGFFPPSFKLGSTRAVQVESWRL